MKKWKLLLATSALVVGGATGFAGAHNVKPGRLAMKEARAAKAFAKLDTDGDGKLTLEEFKAGKLAKRGHHKRLHGGAKRP